MKLDSRELLHLFNASLNNSKNLFDAAKFLAYNYNKPNYPSLGLAEIGLEELGKTYSCLAYYSKAKEIDDWQLFWRDWKSHNTKAHRAYLFEFFCPLRIEVDDHLFQSIPTPRGRFSKEKEAAFYVDIDKQNRKIHIPVDEIKDKECLFIILKIIGLLNSAYYVRDWMNSANDENYKRAISDYAFAILTSNIILQDAEVVIKQMRTDNEHYNNGLSAILSLFKAGNQVK